MKVLIFGSSIVEGFWATRGGWVQRLINDVSAYHVAHQQGAGEGDWMMNLGVAGDTTDKILARFVAETEARRGRGDNELGIVFAQVGANDSMKIGGRYISSLEQFAGNLDKLCALAEQYTPHILFVGLTAMDPEGSATRQFFELDRIQQFEDKLRMFTQAKDIPLVSLLPGMRAQLIRGEQLLSSDGVHPNDNGHQYIYEIVKPHLAKWLPSLNLT